MPNLNNGGPSVDGPADIKAMLDQLTSLFKTGSPYSDVELDALYNVGVQVYQQGKWEDASRLFGMINMLAPFNPCYLTAQGKCLKLLGAYEDACEVFYLAWTIDKQVPASALHAAECLMLAGKKDEAIDLIKEVLATPALTNQNQELREKAEAWITLLSTGEIDA